MTKKTEPRASPVPPKGSAKVSHPGMMGDGTEEQNLNEEGDPSARITKGEVKAAFAGKPTKKA